MFTYAPRSLIFYANTTFVHVEALDWAHSSSLAWGAPKAQVVVAALTYLAHGFCDRSYLLFSFYGALEFFLPVGHTQSPEGFLVVILTVILLVHLRLHSPDKGQGQQEHCGLDAVHGSGDSHLLAARMPGPTESRARTSSQRAPARE